MEREKTEAEREAEKERAKRFKDGKLTRYGMEKTIQEGGAVLHDGTVYSRVEDLPDEADLVAGDAAATEAALAALDQQEAQLGARRARLERARTVPPADKSPSPAKK